MESGHLATDNAPFDQELPSIELLAEPMMARTIALICKTQGRSTRKMYCHIGRKSSDSKCFTFSSKQKYLPHLGSNGNLVKSH